MHGERKKKGTYRGERVIGKGVFSIGMTSPSGFAQLREALAAFMPSFSYFSSLHLTLFNIPIDFFSRRAVNAIINEAELLIN